MLFFHYWNNNNDNYYDDKRRMIMNNIYDVILNFLNNYYEVYEWKNTDDIINVRTAPCRKQEPDKNY